LLNEKEPGALARAASYPPLSLKREREREKERKREKHAAQQPLPVSSLLFAKKESGR